MERSIISAAHYYGRAVEFIGVSVGPDLIARNHHDAMGRVFPKPMELTLFIEMPFCTR
jgi:hypothetical protein